jgi:hypothetical protein
MSVFVDGYIARGEIVQKVRIQSQKNHVCAAAPLAFRLQSSTLFCAQKVKKKFATVREII